MAYCVHHVPGRARFKVPQLRHDPLLASAIEEKIGALGGIRHVEINRPAASMIVHYDGEAHSPETLAAHIRAHAPATNGGVTATASGHANGRMLQSVGQVFGQAVFATIVQRTLERSLLSLLTGVR